MGFKTLQLFTDEYLAQTKTMSPEAILIFLDEFMQLHSLKLIADYEQQRKQWLNTNRMTGTGVNTGSDT
jgi:hypothetical protein